MNFFTLAITAFNAIHMVVHGHPATRNARDNSHISNGVSDHVERSVRAPNSTHNTSNTIIPIVDLKRHVLRSIKAPNSTHSAYNTTTPIIDLKRDSPRPTRTKRRLDPAYHEIPFDWESYHLGIDREILDEFFVNDDPIYDATSDRMGTRPDTLNYFDQWHEFRERDLPAGPVVSGSGFSGAGGEEEEEKGDEWTEDEWERWRKGVGGESGLGSTSSSESPTTMSCSHTSICTNHKGPRSASSSSIFNPIPSSGVSSSSNLILTSNGITISFSSPSPSFSIIVTTSSTFTSSSTPTSTSYSFAATATFDIDPPNVPDPYFTPVSYRVPDRNPEPTPEPEPTSDTGSHKDLDAQLADDFGFDPFFAPFPRPTPTPPPPPMEIEPKPALDLADQLAADFSFDKSWDYLYSPTSWVPYDEAHRKALAMQVQMRIAEQLKHPRQPLICDGPHEESQTKVAPFEMTCRPNKLKKIKYWNPGMPVNVLPEVRDVVRLLLHETIWDFRCQRRWNHDISFDFLCSPQKISPYEPEKLDGLYNAPAIITKDDTWKVAQLKLEVQKAVTELTFNRKWHMHCEGYDGFDLSPMSCDFFTIYPVGADFGTWHEPPTSWIWQDYVNSNAGCPFPYGPHNYCLF